VSISIYQFFSRKNTIIANSFVCEYLDKRLQNVLDHESKKVNLYPSNLSQPVFHHDWCYNLVASGYFLFGILKDTTKQTACQGGK